MISLVFPVLCGLDNDLVVPLRKVFARSLIVHRVAEGGTRLSEAGLREFGLFEASRADQSDHCKRQPNVSHLAADTALGAGEASPRSSRDSK